jgi:1-deoxy-D-xylulose-5-phosphate synthase
MTHQGVYDISYLRALPNMSIAMPKDANEMQAMLKTALQIGGPKAIRWPRGKVEPVSQSLDEVTIEWGRWEILKEGSEAYILAMGPTLEYALKAASHNPKVGVVNARFIKPLDEVMLLLLANQVGHLITVEDHVLQGGLGSAVAEVLSDHQTKVSLTRLGIPATRNFWLWPQSHSKEARRTGNDADFSSSFGLGDR